MVNFPTYTGRHWGRDVKGLTPMADRLVRNSNSLRAVPATDWGHGAIEPMLPALLRGVIFISVLAAPFVAALLAG
ncbi:hypothetical protein BJS_09034 [Bradyrhizobium japonicum SEMIA 5079]|nr:hypothetical protein BJS_09034 [Bradyrhizobium japonicum SEMIA 5079]